MNICANYSIESEFPSGSSNVQVLLARDRKSGKKVVLKVFPRDSPMFMTYEEEIRVQQLCNHPNILKVLDIIYQESCVVIVLEYCKYGDLYGYIKNNRMNFSMLISIYRQIVEAVAYLHRKGIAHLDLKLENILIDDHLEPKLCDFGCCETPEQRKRSFFNRGTLVYMAPEMFGEGNGDNRPADIWSLGILLYALITQHFPWYIDEEEDEKKQILSGRMGKMYLLPKKIQIIVEKCCIVDPKSRLNIDGLLALMHELNLFPGKFLNQPIGQRRKIVPQTIAHSQTDFRKKPSFRTIKDIASHEIIKKIKRRRVTYLE